jgi:hypothetical protein
MTATRASTQSGPDGRHIAVLRWLRTALRVHLGSDRPPVLPDLGERLIGDDKVAPLVRNGLRMAAFIERGKERPMRCYFDGVSDAAQYLLLLQTARMPIDVQPDACNPKPS